MRKKKAIQWLYSELPELIDKGILAPEALAKLRAYYGDVESGMSKLQLAFLLFGVLGATLIGLGIILIFAHNWDQFPRSVKTTISMGPMIIAQILAGWVLFKRNQSVAWRESSTIFLMITIGAAISMISQIYNIGGSMKTFSLTWMLLSVPLVYLMRVNLVSIFYLIGIVSWASFPPHYVGQPIIYWLLVGLVVPHFWSALKKDPYSQQALLLSWTYSLIFCFGLGSSLQRIIDNWWIIIFSSGFAVLYLAGALQSTVGSNYRQRPFYSIGVAGISIFSLILTYEEPWKSVDWSWHWNHYHSFDLISCYFLLFILVITAIWLLVLAARKKQPSLIAFGAFPILAILGHAANTYDSGPFLGVAIFNAYVFILGMMTVYKGIKQNRLGIVNCGMALLAALIVIRFFDSNYGILERGLAFIVVGSAFLITNFILMRRKQHHEK